MLDAVATMLNAGGAALLSVYDAAVSVKANGFPRWEKSEVGARLRESEETLERTYIEIGKDVVQSGSAWQSSAAREAAVARAIEHRAEIARLERRLEEIEAEQAAALEAAMAWDAEAVFPAPESSELTPALAAAEAGGSSIAAEMKETSTETNSER